MHRAATTALLVAALAPAAGCPGEPATDGSLARAAGNPPAETGALPVSSEAPAAAPPRAPVADEVMEVPAGTVRLGSRPGAPGRVPRHEADLVETPVAAFRIDRLPYPNDPARPPMTDVTREQAAELCAAQDKRLCTELEWERACKGDGAPTFPGGGEFDIERCTLDPLACASPLGVLGLGVLAAEWTASAAEAGLARGVMTGIVRGAGPGAPASEHRCAARRAADPATSSDATGFRCCAGARPDHQYPAAPQVRAFDEVEVDTARLRRVLATVPELERFADDFTPASSSAIGRAFGATAPPERAPHGWAIVRAPVLAWSPEPGEATWVISGTGGGAGLLAVLHPLADGSFVHGASFVLQDEPRAPAVMYTPDVRTELQWTVCFHCLGEGGTITPRGNGTVAILQQ